MKHLFKIICFFSIAALAFTSCKKDESIVSVDKATNPQLTSSVANDSSLVLKDFDADKNLMTLKWTNPNYYLSTGISTQTVTYSVEIDSAGKNFGSSKKFKTQLTTADLTKDITVGTFNKYVVDAGFKAGILNAIEMRIVATIGTDGSPAYSNVLKYKVNPYPIVKVQLPSSGDLFLVGSATNGGWSNPVPVPTQQFTKTSATTYEIVAALSANNEFLLLPVNGSWGSKYAVPNKGVADLWKGGEMKFYQSGGDNIPGPPTAGNYKITVDFQEGIFTVVPQ